LTPDQTVEQFGAKATVIAEQAAATDGEHALAPTTPSPTPGETRILAGFAETVPELAAAERRELERLATRRAVITQVLADDDAEREVTVPESVPLRSVRPYEYVVAAILGVGETVALSGPVATVLDFPDGSLEQYLIPGILAGIAGGLAHLAGDAAARARRARVPAAQDKARRMTVFWAMFVLVVGAVAVLIRTRAAAMDSLIDGGEPLDAAGLGAFALFTLAFCVGNLGASFSYHRRLTNAEDERETRYIDGLRKELPALEAQLADGGAEAAAVRSQELLDMAAHGIVAYRLGLAAGHPSVEAQVAWAGRTARELADGSLWALLFPGRTPTMAMGDPTDDDDDDGGTPPPPPPPGTHTGDTQTDEPGPATTDPSDAGPTTTGGGNPTDPRSATTSTPGPSDAEPEDDDLFDAILNPRRS
jgi:hypothetical protein